LNIERIEAHSSRFNWAPHGVGAFKTILSIRALQNLMQHLIF